MSRPEEPENAGPEQIAAARRQDSAAAHAENPFSSRHVRPGAIAYQFPPGMTTAALVGRLRENRWRGEIIGPHGSGKSALLATLISAIRQTAKAAVLVELHDGQRRLPIDVRAEPTLTGGSLLVIDGYEQLSRLSRWSVRWFCRRRGVGLLVTAHRSVGLPRLFQTDADLALARRLVEHLTGGRCLSLEPGELEERFARHGGNLREMLFDLYDLYEQRSKGA